MPYNYSFVCSVFSVDSVPYYNFRTYETLVKNVVLLKAVDGFRYILSLFRSHHLMAGQTEFLLVAAFGDGQGKTVP